ncbi:unnamed protein product [Ilex paraguariensis]|uniref:AP2/ERF domain-containing protein n=1 Tax=Ilex paraguariensis TaxID=185542 RepID=A0ABC8SQS7_9AQUA
MVKSAINTNKESKPLVCWLPIILNLVLSITGATKKKKQNFASFMVKPESEKPAETSESKYKGVRKRKWGKYVSEIRLPNSRERIWLGSYDTPEKAARAFDAALFCLRGPTAQFNFPDNPPDIVGGRSLTPAEIQVAAARLANSEARISQSNNSSSFSEVQMESQSQSPSPSISDGALQVDNERAMDLDQTFLDHYSTLGPENNVADFGIFPGFDDLSGDFCMPPLPNVDYGEENNDGFSSQGGSFLWNF